MDRNNPNRPTGGFRFWEQVVDKALREIDVHTTGRMAREMPNTRLGVDWLQRHNINGKERKQG
jgi:hypothetical protein